MSLLVYFDTKHVDRIKSGEKRLTMRYRWDKDIPADRTLKFMDGDNLLFGQAVLLEQYTMSVENVINTEWKYHRNHDSLAELSSEFSNYYPNVKLQKDTELTILEWNDTFRANPVYANR